jgi:UDP:flavonoid glycosyltransferase YjiC (YdhE family)
VIVSGRLDAAVPGVVVADYAPYSLLLRRCRAVVSQAGAGVMLKTLAAGVPQLCLPKAATDQFRNAAACEASGAGLRLVGDEATPEAVAAATGRLIEDVSFAEAARGVAVEIAAMPSPADVARTLQSCITVHQVGDTLCVVAQ